MSRIGRLLLVFLALPLAAAGSCDGSSPTSPSTTTAPSSTPSTVVPPATVTLAIGESVVVEGPGLPVAFTGVVEDSRCPSDVTCVWAGRAVVQVEVDAGRSDAPAIALEVGGPSAEARGLRLTAEALDPYPRSDRPPSPEDYRLRLRIELASGG